MVSTMSRWSVLRNEGSALLMGAEIFDCVISYNQNVIIVLLIIFSPMESSSNTFNDCRVSSEPGVIQLQRLFCWTIFFENSDY